MFSVLRNRRAAAIVLAGCAVLLAPAAANAAKLTLINGWSTASGTRPAAAKIVQGVVHFEGAIAGGTTDQPFVLPASMRPAAEVYMKVDLCNAHNGRLYIFPTGESHIEAENEDFSQAQCFTSLDGASFAMAADHYKPLKLKKGWTGYGGTFTPAVKVVNGVVQFEGAMATPRKSDFAFTLPGSMSPGANVYVPVDMCNATNGRLNIAGDGSTTVEAERHFKNAKCFTSLEGVQFAADTVGFTPLTLMNGWTNAPFGTRNAAVRISGGVVQFEGAIASGSNNNPFVLPQGFRPGKTVRVPVDLCNATNGRLEIDKNGSVYIDTEGGFSDATCFTSLDGVSFVQ